MNAADRIARRVASTSCSSSSRWGVIKSRNGIGSLDMLPLGMGKLNRDGLLPVDWMLLHVHSWGTGRVDTEDRGVRRGGWHRHLDRVPARGCRTKTNGPSPSEPFDRIARGGEPDVAGSAQFREQLAIEPAPQPLGSQ